MKSFRFVFVTVLLVLLSTFNISANSSEPPMFTVIVNNAPEDLKLSLILDENVYDKPILLDSYTKAWENYYRFFYHSYESDDVYENVHGYLQVQTGDKTYQIDLPWNEFSMYNNLLTLDLEKQAITYGENAWRQPLLISLRVLLTLIIEGLIFLFFRYKTKRSWLTFLFINLITQGFLNISISGSINYSYWIFVYAFLEIIIGALEMILFAFLLKEHRKRRAVLYAFIANLASLLIGGLIISYLPL